MSSSSSIVSSNPPLNSDRRKRKKKFAQNQTLTNKIDSQIEWKSDAQQQIYSSKLLHALREVRNGGGAAVAGATPAPARRVREAADRALAVTARGRSRWSRAILTSRLKLKFMKKNSVAKRKRKVTAVISSSTGGSRLPKKSRVGVLRLRSKGLPAVQRKGRVLGRLVPGCRKQPLPVVLDEVTDYIAALQMQVRAMSAIAELLSVSDSSSSSGFDERLNQLGSSRAPRS